MAVAYSTQDAICNQKWEEKGCKKRMKKIWNKFKSIRRELQK